MERHWITLGVGVLWVLLYSTDYLLMRATELLRTHPNLARRLEFGGSLELHPVLEPTVHKEKRVSTSFLVLLALGAILFPAGMDYLLRMAQQQPDTSLAQLPQAAAGLLFIPRFAVISTQLQYLMLFRRMLRVPEAEGVHMRYDRDTVVAMNQARQLEVAAFCLLAALVSSNAFFVGGALGVMSVYSAVYRTEYRRKQSEASRTGSRP